MFSASSLWTPATLGAIGIPNRILMAPMTRNRAEADGRATPRMAAYYRQRASAGLIVSEMTYVSESGKPYLDMPGLASDAHADAWRGVTDAVHASGGRIFVQIGHGGRIGHPAIFADGRLPVAPSAIAADGHLYTRTGAEPFVTPRALETHEIAGVVDEFAAAARRAQAAGFDGVELHAANGYLLDQFLRDGANRRTDGYGGDAAGRARFLVEVVSAVSEVIGADRIGVRVSPFNAYNDIADSTPFDTFAQVGSALAPFGLAYLHLVQGGAPDTDAAEAMARELTRRFRGPLVVNGGFTRQSAQAAIAQGAVAVSFGSAFLANPDLPWRLATSAPLNTPDVATFYTGGDRGYADYPTLDAAAAA
jgi:N-ethylmaleimide reductase